jgi:hypothetical protein
MKNCYGYEVHLNQMENIPREQLLLSILQLVKYFWGGYFYALYYFFEANSRY